MREVGHRALPPGSTLRLLAHSMRQGPSGLGALNSIHREDPLFNAEGSLIDPVACVGMLEANLPIIVDGLGSRGGSSSALERILSDIQANPNIQTDLDAANVALARCACAFRDLPPELYRDTVVPLLGSEGLEQEPLDAHEMSTMLYMKEQIVEQALTLSSTDRRRATSRSAYVRKYEEIEKIGGKMSDVILVQERATGKLFVVKKARRENEIRNILFEIEAMRRVDHRCSVKYLEALGHTVNGVCEVMLIEEYLDPKDWASLDKLLDIRSKKHAILKEAQVISIMDQILSLICEMRRQGVVHRDIKPSNVMVKIDAEGAVAVKVIDYGAANLTTEARRDTTILAGTPTHYSPEQLGSGEMGAWVDIFATGLLAMELMLGRERNNSYLQQPIADDMAELRASTMGRYSAALIARVGQMLNIEDRVARVDVLSMPSLQPIEMMSRAGSDRQQESEQQDGEVENGEIAIEAQSIGEQGIFLSSVEALEIYCSKHPIDIKKADWQGRKKLVYPILFFGAALSINLVLKNINFDNLALEGVLQMLSVFLFASSPMVIRDIQLCNRRTRRDQAYRVGDGYTMTPNSYEVKNKSYVNPIDLDPEHIPVNKEVFINGLEIESLVGDWERAAGSASGRFNVNYNGRRFEMDLIFYNERLVTTLANIAIANDGNGCFILGRFDSYQRLIVEDIGQAERRNLLMP